MSHASPAASPDAFAAALNGVCALPSLGVIRAQGEDAASFLHGQLTQDFTLLKHDQARLAAFCNAKGRMQASFVGFKREADEILLLCSADLLPATLKRLSMFVLRAKVKLSDATADFALRGLVGDAAGAVLPAAAAPWSLQRHGAATVVTLYPALGQPRVLWVAPAGTPEPSGPALDPAVWAWGEVQSGVSTLSQPVFEAFVPQMLNYESVGGVNFKKGCYPGQEVVARSQFRGTLKRRGFVVHADAPLAAGMAVFHDSDREQPAGLIAQAAAVPNDGGWDAIASLQLSATEGGALHAGGPDGPVLVLRPLPYPLLKDI